MGEELEKWYKDFLERVIEKIRKGQELTNSETQIVANYMANTQLRDHVVYLVNKLTELNANLERRLMDRLVEVERNLRDEIRKTREELLANDEKIRQELLKRIEGLEVRISASDMKIQEVDSKVEATRSDLGLVAEEVYISNFINRLVRENQAILNIYRKYETEHGEVDAIVETNEKIYVLEVKMRAEPKDVDVLLLKTKAILQERQDKGVIPVLTGSKINRIVRNYAKGLNVMIS